MPCVVRYELPKLSYRHDELEPYIDGATVQIHHQVHHQAYTDGLNRALEKIQGLSHPRHISFILSDMDSVPEQGRDAIRFFGGGYENHNLYWQGMIPGGGGAPGGKLADAIEIYYDGFDDFKRMFAAKAESIQGSGWCWLVFDQTYNRIEVQATSNQDSPWMSHKVPLLGLDVWEHAYYIKYQERRHDYVRSWWSIINWDFIQNRYSELAP